MKQFSKYFFPFLLISLTLFLAYVNYVPGTFLSGWDSLHPEFNLALYLKRIFWGVWQAHQGVGAVAAQAHAAELTRLPLVAILTLILPLNLVRYSFFFLTLGTGALGMYYLCRYLLSQQVNKQTNSASFIAALFYLLNLATLQQYYVPLEMFAVHFASLPWLIFLSTSYLREGKKKNLIWFSLVTLLSSSMAHTATLFYVYFGAFCLFIVTVILLKRRKDILKRGVVLVFLTAALNLFWLAPNIYYIVNHVKDVENAKITRVFSDEAFLQSRAYGDIHNLGLLKNFLFNWREYSFQKSTFVDLMDEWNVHLARAGVAGIGYLTIGIALLGIIVAFFKKNKYALSLLPVLLLSAFFLINENAPFTAIFVGLKNNFPILGEALRFPFTKFSFLLTACLAIYLAYSSQLILQVLAKIKLGFVWLVAISLALVYFMLPAFQGKLISPSMKVNIPDSYFQLFKWFEGRDPNARIAKLPMQTLWGWNFYSWGYQGAGFSWFGIPQPTLDREFDRWGLYNEDFYRQASGALYENNLPLFEKTLLKYGVKYLLMDESIINAGGSEKVLLIPETKHLLTASKHIKLVKQFGQLSIYESNFGNEKDGLFVPNKLVGVSTNLVYSAADPVFNKFGDYFEYPTGTSFPFANLDRRGPVEIRLGDKSIVLTNRETNHKLEAPITRIISEDFKNKRGFERATNCDLLKIGKVSKTYLSGAINYRAENGGVSCDFLDYFNLTYSDGYLLHIKGENKEGRSLKIYLFNVETGRMDLEELLPKGNFDETFVVYPKNIDGAGYILNLESRSYGRIASENVLEAVEIYKTPIDSIINIQYDTQNNINFTNSVDIVKSSKINPALYFIKTNGVGLLALNQGYEQGWIAVDLSSLKINLLPHVRVDSWANGWQVNGQTDIIIFFWPQGLELLGFVVLVGIFFFILKAKD